MRVGEPPEFRQDLQRGLRRLGRQRAAVETAGAQPNHFLFAVNDFERQIGADAHDNHVQRIRTYIDRGDAHWGLPTIMGVSAASLPTMQASTRRYDLLQKRLDRFTQMLQGSTKAT